MAYTEGHVLILLTRKINLLVEMKMHKKLQETTCST